MSMLKILIPVGLAGVAAFALMGHANASPTDALGPMPDNIRAMVEKALDSADPETMRIVAAKVRALGFKAQADSLLTAASEIELELKRVGNAAPKASSVPGVSSGSVVGTPIKTAADQAARDLAGRTAAAMTGARKGSEDRKVVTAYQTQENARNQPVGKIDGLYGAKTALTLAKDHGIVPPKPLYWPSDSTKAAATKAFYKGELLKFAAADAPRKEEWNQAAAAIS